jgi:hypothetical protein
MKKHLTLFAFLASVALQAQFKKNDIFAEGSFGFGRHSPGVMMRQTSFVTVNPSLGFMVTENLAIIGGVNFASSRFYDNMGMGPHRLSRSFSLFLGVRRFIPLSDRFYLFVQGLAGYGDALADMYGVSGVPSANGFERWNVQISPGFAYFPAERLAFTARLGTLGYEGRGNAQSANVLMELGAIRLGLLYRFN